MSGCICERVVFTNNAERIEGIMRPNPDCRQHGRPDDIWRAGDPLARHNESVMPIVGLA